MSDTSQGEGWWQASDGKWYAPEQQSSSPASTPSPAGGSSGSGLGPFAFDLKRLSKEEQITGGASLVLFILLFLPWYTASVSVYSYSANGLHHFWMYFVLLICLAILAYLVAIAGFGKVPINLPMPKERLLLRA